MKRPGTKAQQIKGGAKQVEGKIQKGVGNVEDALDKADKQSRDVQDRKTR